MARLGRILLLGVVAMGLVLALTTATTHNRAAGQATGYGSDTVPPSQLEIGQAAASNSGGGGGSHTTVIVIGGLVIVLLGGAGAYFFSKHRSTGWD